MKISPWLSLASLLALAFALATGMSSTANELTRRARSDDLFGKFFGDGRKMLANQFFTMADVYFHSGYYPSVFDQGAKEQKEIIAASHGSKESEEDEEKEDFMGKPKDWIDAFGRHFRITEHRHLEGHQEREILPWLRMAADLDPHKIETYTVGAYFLRDHLNRPDQAEAFLREGLRNNRDSAELLFALGRIYFEDKHDPDRARNVWHLGVKKIQMLTPEEQKDQEMVMDELEVNLARLEEEAGNNAAALEWLEAAKKVSPSPEAIQKRIDDLRKKMSAAPVPPSAAH